MLAEDVNYCPRCGSNLIIKHRMGRDRPICPHCDWIYFADPKVAAAVFVTRNDKILLVRRSNSPKRGFWTLPAGFVDAGEDPARAAERECLEETGLDVQVVELLDVLYGQEHPNGAHIVIIYRGRIQSGELQAGDDADRVGFFSSSDLPRLAFRTTKIVASKYFSEAKPKQISKGS
jgi:ADP-ribose pyrophosphatase YjhB (NUDIX family)